MGSKKGIPKSEEHKRKIGLANKGKVRTDKHKQNISEATKEAMQRPEVHKRLCEGRKKYCQTNVHKEKFAERTSKLWKEHPELHPNHKMVNVSKNQLKVYELVKLHYPETELEFPLKTKGRTLYIDVAIPNIKIAIEYDGGYWHKNEIKNQERDDRIKEQGWKVIHVKSDEKDRNIDFVELNEFLKTHG